MNLFSSETYNGKELVNEYTYIWYKRIGQSKNLRIGIGSPLIDGIFLVQKMCICSCVTLSTTLLMRAVQFNARSACDASTFTSCIYIFLRLASKYLNCHVAPTKWYKNYTNTIENTK